MMALVEKVTGTQKLGETCITYPAKDMLDAFRVFQEIDDLASN